MRSGEQDRSEVHVEFEARGSTIIARLEGRLHGVAADELDTELLRAAREAENFILDLGKLEFISSTGLRTFLKLRRELTAKGGVVIFARANEMVSEVFEISSFEHLFPTFSTMAEAYKYLGME